MEEHEQYLGGVLSPYLAKGLEIFDIQVTTRRVIVAEGRILRGPALGTYIPGPPSRSLDVLTDPKKEEFKKEFKKKLESKGFQVRKEEIKKILLKRPGRVRGVM